MGSPRGVVGVPWSAVATVLSGRRTCAPRVRSPVKAWGLVTSWTRWRSIARTAGAPGSSETTCSSQIFSRRVRGWVMAAAALLRGAGREGYQRSAPGRPMRSSRVQHGRHQRRSGPRLVGPSPNAAAGCGPSPKAAVECESSRGGPVGGCLPSHDGHVAGCGPMLRAAVDCESSPGGPVAVRMDPESPGCASRTSDCVPTSRPQDSHSGAAVDRRWIVDHESMGRPRARQLRLERHLPEASRLRLPSRTAHTSVGPGHGDVPASAASASSGWAG